MLDFTLLLAFLLFQQSTGAEKIIEFTAPGPPSVPQLPDTTVEIFCHTEGELGWQVNGKLVNFNSITVLTRRGFTFKSLPSSPPQYKWNVTIEVAGNNNTDIRCVVISSTPEEPGNHSRTVTILVAGPPLPPSPMLKVVNATELQILWEEPFTSEGYAIKQYNISVNNMQPSVITDRVFTWSRQDIAQSCEELKFSVTATNDVGDSETANISGEFPVAPGPFISPVKGEVTFFMDGQPRLEVCFSPPRICRSQSSSFTITVQKLDENGNTDTVYTEGPVGYTNGSGAENITRDIRSGLERNQMYLLTVHFSTVAGDSNSSATFTTGPSDSPIPPVTDGPDRSNKVLIIIISGVIGAVGVVFLLGIVLIGAFTYLRRKAKRRERDESTLAGSSLEMVPNPIYEGPLYDIINDSTQLMTLSNETPPRVAPRRDKNNRSTKLPEMAGANYNGAVASSPEDAYTFMKPVGAVKDCCTQEQMRPSTATENRYVVGD